jgi:RES domain-containing protein
VRVYRICRAAHRALDGEGARLYGGRWNSPDRAAVYASGSLALAALEYLVHVDPGDVPNDLVAITINVPDGASAEEVEANALPAGWEQVAAHPACAVIGDAWLRAGRSLLLRVPSAPIPEEANILINPRHAEAHGVSTAASRPFFFDPRLLQ